MLEPPNTTTELIARTTAISIEIFAENKEEMQEPGYGGIQKLKILPKLHLGPFGHNSEKNVQKRGKYGVFYSTSFPGMCLAIRLCELISKF